MPSTDAPLFHTDPPEPPPHGDTFPWPIADPLPTDADMGTINGLALAMEWPNLTPAERCVAMFVGDGLGGPGNAPVLARHLGITDAECAELLWSLLRKGFLQAVAGWWTR